MLQILNKAKIVFVFLIVAAAALTQTEFEVFRLMQYQNGEVEVGSQSAAWNFPAVHFTDSVFRKIVMLRLEDITLENLVEFLNSKPLGVLLMLPNVAQKDISPELEKLWISVQDTLTSNKINVPIFFTVENEEKVQLYKDLEEFRKKSENGELDTFFLTRQTPYFEVKAADPKLIDSLELTVLYAVLKTDEEIRSSDKPLMLITAPYDFMSVAPSIGNGANTASGVMAILDLSRFFSQLLEDQKLKMSAEYDFMFLLTPGSFLGYEPSGQFVESMNQKIQDKIKFVLSLDSIAYDNDITVHMGGVNSKDSQFAKNLMVQFKKSATLYNKEFKLSKKNQPGSFYEWEHIRYSEKGFFAATMTTSKFDEGDSIFQKFSVFDNIQNFDKNAYETNLKVVAEFLLKLSYPQLDSETAFLSSFEGQASLIDPNMQQHVLEFITNNPRIPTEISTDSKVVHELSRILKFHLKNIKSKRIKVNNPKYYQDSPVRHVLLAYDYQSRIIYILGLIMAVAAAYYTYNYFRSGSGGKVKRD